MTLQLFIVDDEKPARERLRRMLAQIPDVLVIGEAANGAEALKLINQLIASQQSLDGIFMDIEML